MNERHVVIVGAGIVGVSCALYARRRGWHVTIVDPRGVAGGASSGNAGVVALSECVPVGTPGTLAAVPGMLMSRSGPLRIRPSYFPKLLPWLLRMLASSSPSTVQRLSADLSNILQHALDAHFDLADAAGVRANIAATGWLKVYESEDSFAKSSGEYRLMRDRGVPCIECDKSAISDMEPLLAGRFRRGIFHPTCHQVGEPGAYVRALAALAARNGVDFRKVEAMGFTFASNRVKSVLTSDGEISASAVVLAAGAWSKLLATQLGCKIPLDTERGYHMMLDTSLCRTKLHRPIYWAEKALVLTPMDDSVRVTSSVEFAGLNGAPNYDLVLKHLTDVQRLLPGSVLRPGSEWLGFRPSMPDSIPVIGRVPDLSNAILAFGHGHLGITLGPITGKIVGAVLDAEAAPIDLAPFSPSRFPRIRKRPAESSSSARRLPLRCTLKGQ